MNTIKMFIVYDSENSPLKYLIKTTLNKLIENLFSIPDYGISQILHKFILVFVFLRVFSLNVSVWGFRQTKVAVPRQTI